MWLLICLDFLTAQWLDSKRKEVGGSYLGLELPGRHFRRILLEWSQGQPRFKSWELDSPS